MPIAMHWLIDPDTDTDSLLMDACMGMGKDWAKSHKGGAAGHPLSPLSCEYKNVLFQ
jgi:hypothetical protein